MNKDINDMLSHNAEHVLHIDNQFNFETGCKVTIIKDSSIQGDVKIFPGHDRVMVDGKDSHQDSATVVADEDDPTAGEERCNPMAATAALADYMAKLQPLANAQYRPKFDLLVHNMLADQKVSGWLMKARKCQFKEFNKGRVFKIACMLRNLKVLRLFADQELNQLLEGTTHDTSYRKNMVQRLKEEDEIEGILSTLLAE